MQGLAVMTLRSAGFEVYDFKTNDANSAAFRWSEIDPSWGSWGHEEYLKALTHPLAETGFAADMAAMEEADTFVLVMPCGRSAHLELGWAVGKGKRTCVLLGPEPCEPELMVKMCDYVATSMMDLLGWLGGED